VLVAVGWLQGVRRLFAAWWFVLSVLRNDAETVEEDLTDAGLGREPVGREGA
jgi:hypothetical protein